MIIIESNLGPLTPLCAIKPISWHWVAVKESMGRVSSLCSKDVNSLIAFREGFCFFFFSRNFVYLFYFWLSWVLLLLRLFCSVESGAYSSWSGKPSHSPAFMNEPILCTCESINPAYQAWCRGSDDFLLKNFYKHFICITWKPFTQCVLFRII